MTHTSVAFMRLAPKIGSAAATVSAAGSSIRLRHVQARTAVLFRLDNFQPLGLSQAVTVAGLHLYESNQVPYFLLEAVMISHVIS